MNIENLYGIYELVSIEAQKDGLPTDERATSGMFVFTRDHQLSVVSGSTTFVMAYTGSFEVNGDQLLINAKACVIPERVGMTMVRQIQKMDGENLVLSADNKVSGMHTVLTWKKKIQL